MAKFTWGRRARAARARRKSILRGGSISYKMNQTMKSTPFNRKPSSFFSRSKRKSSLLSITNNPHPQGYDPADYAYSEYNGGSGSGALKVLLFFVAIIVIVIVGVIGAEQIKWWMMTPEERRNVEAQQKACDDLAKSIDECRRKGQYPCGSKCGEDY